MKKNEYTLSFAQANGYALGLIIPIFAAYLLPYGLLYGWETLGSDIIAFFTNIPLFLISLVAGTIIHELLHAVSWSWMNGIPWSKIHFGFKWRTITPYVHCPEPIEVSNYRWGVVMPGLILGVLPFLASLIFKNSWLLGFGLFFTLAASGDFLILWLLRKVDKGLLVQDHPDLIGCLILDPDKLSNYSNF